MHNLSTAAAPSAEAAQARDTAQAFIDAGFNLIRLHPMTPEGNCTCWREAKDGCNQPGKHPTDKKDARPDYREHDALFEIHLDNGDFDHGFGVLLDGTGTLVVDVDARNGGLRGFEKLVEDFPEVAGAGFVVETGSGNGSRHLYFSAPAEMRLKQSLREYPGIDFKSSGWVVAPGSMHRSGSKYSVALGGVDEIDTAPADLIQALERKGPALRVINGGAAPDDIDVEELIDMLSFVDSANYDVWFRVGLSIYGALGDSGFEVWDSWSSEASSYCPDAVAAKWADECSKADPGGIGYIANLARESGWRPAFEREIDRLHREDMDAIGPVTGTDGAHLLTRSGLPLDSEIFGWHPKHGLTVWTQDAKGRAGFVVVGDTERPSEWRASGVGEFVRLPTRHSDGPAGEVLAVHDIRLAITLWHRSGRAVWALGGDMVIPAALDAAAQEGFTVRLLRPEDLE